MTEGATDTAKISAATGVRRTFAIISHPDAGKTTLTEKLLLYAGMIRTAGMVHGRKQRAAVSSDWMQLEQERGISITASAMQFNYKQAVINVLDTPGHQDFSEDTYRTLTAADSAVMVIDAAKGVEVQTRKLFQVCRMRGLPILTFINKMDLPGRDPFELLAELEQVLGIKTAPLNWPIGSGRNFKGVADCLNNDLILFERAATAGAKKVAAQRCSLAEAYRTERLNAVEKANLESELDLLAGAGNPFNRADFLAGQLSPVFFGSALTNFGVEPFFDSFAELAPPPGPRRALRPDGSEITIDPIKDPFSAFVFKIQANMDPKHRDSMAFLRIVSGCFERDLCVKHPRLNKEIRLSRSHSMFGGDRSILEQAYPGDIVGVVNPKAFHIGDTVSLTGDFSFPPLPQFSPEVVAQISPADANRKKAFDKGLEQLSSEGAVLILQRWNSHERLVAAVGRLQFEVLSYRLLNEYQVPTRLDLLPYQAGAWVCGDPASFKPPSSTMLAQDLKGRLIFLYSQDWERSFALKQNPDHQLLSFV